MQFTKHAKNAKNLLTSLKVRRLEIPGVEHLHPQVLVQHLAAHGDAAQVGRVHVHVVVVVVAAAVVVAAVCPAEAGLLQRPLLQMPLPEVPGDELAAVRRVELGSNSIDIYNLGQV